MPDGVSQQPSPRLLPIDEARAELDRVLFCFAADAFAYTESQQDRFGRRVWYAPTVAINTSPGLEIETAMRAVHRHVTEAKQRGLPCRVLCTLPTLALMHQMAADMRRQGLHVAEFCGRAAPDPDANGQRMCWDRDAVAAAYKLGIPVETSVCRSGHRECAFYGQCGYQRQKPAAGQADVVICHHSYLFFGLPTEVGEFGLMVIVGSFFQTGLRRPHKLQLEDIEQDIGRWPVLTEGLPDAAATGELRELRSRIGTALRFMNSEQCTLPAALRSVGITNADCRKAITLEARRSVQNLLHPGMTPSEFAAAVQGGAPNQRTRLYRFLWSECAAYEPTGRVEVKDHAVLLHERRDLRESVISKPVLLVDSAIETGILDQFFVFYDMETVLAHAPNMHIHRVLASFGISGMLADAEVHQRLRDEVRERSQGHASLVITYQERKKVFRDLPYVQTTHFNAFHGLDRWQHVQHVFIIGRPMPDDFDMNNKARSLSGESIAFECLGWKQCTVMLRSGTAWIVKVKRHIHPVAAVLDRAIPDAEVVRAIGCARAFHRSAEHPVHVWLYTDAATDLLLDSVRAWNLGPVEIMTAGGIVLYNLEHAARAFNKLLPSVDAMRKRRSRSREVPDISIIEGDVPDASIIPVCVYMEVSGTSGWRGFRYQLAGRGQRWARGCHAPALVPDARAWLQEKLGPLVSFN